VKRRGMKLVNNDLIVTGELWKGRYYVTLIDRRNVSIISLAENLNLRNDNSNAFLKVQRS